MSAIHFPTLTYRTLRRVLVPIVRGLYRLETRGVERLPVSGPAIVVANHESVVDPFVLGCAVECELRFVAMAELWRYRSVAWAMNRLRAILTGAPIVPIRLVGTARALSRRQIGFPRLVVIVGEPITVERAPVTIAAARRLTEDLRAAVESLG